jgi:murein DD-endopeptidase MepM/ murein hydrolase activator NlpD
MARRQALRAAPAPLPLSRRCRDPAVPGECPWRQTTVRLQTCYKALMNGAGLRTRLAWPLHRDQPVRRRVWVSLCAVGLVGIAIATLLLGHELGTSSHIPGPAYAAQVALAPSESPSDLLESPTPSATPSPTGQQLMTPLVLVPPQDLTGYVWPLANARVTLPFGPTSWGEAIVNGQRFHDGLDMSTTCGDKVYAAHDGVVLAAGRHYDDYVGWDGDLTPYYNWLDQHRYWNSLPIVIVIDDGDGYRSIYAHESRVTVQPGQIVKVGQLIGYEGQTGNASGCHVHFGLFSPLETRTFALDPALVARDQMPAAEFARVDPLLVLPFRCEIEEMVALRPAEAEACPAPTPRPTARPTPTRAPSPSSTAAPTGEATESPTATASQVVAPGA